MAQAAASHASPAPPVAPRNWMVGATYKVQTPLGTAYVTLNQDADGQPFELFLNIGKGGSDVAAVSEGLGRLISLVLQLPDGLTPAARLDQVAEQLSGIGGASQIGFGPHRVRSLPDALAQVLRQLCQPEHGHSSATPTAAK